MFQVLWIILDTNGHRWVGEGVYFLWYWSKVHIAIKYWSLQTFIYFQLKKKLWLISFISIVKLQIKNYHFLRLKFTSIVMCYNYPCLFFLEMLITVLEVLMLSLKTACIRILAALGSQIGAYVWKLSKFITNSE